MAKSWKRIDVVSRPLAKMEHAPVYTILSRVDHSTSVSYYLELSAADDDSLLLPAVPIYTARWMTSEEPFCYVPLSNKDCC